jgi:hypothetical protein
VQPPLPGEPTWWAETLDVFWWLDRHGLTPDQVDALPAVEAVRLRQVTELVDEVRADNHRKASQGG